MIFLLLSIITYFLILNVNSKSRHYRVFDTSLLLVLPGAIGLIWFQVIKSVYAGRIKAFSEVLDVSFIISAELSLSIILFAILKRVLGLELPGTQNNQLQSLLQKGNMITFGIIAIIFALIEQISDSIVISKLAGDCSEIFLTLLLLKVFFQRQFFELALHFKIIKITALFVTLICYILITDDKGGIVTILTPAILLSQFLNFKRSIGAIYSVVLVFFAGLILSVMNFSQGFFGSTTDLYINLTEIFETDVLTNYYLLNVAQACIIDDPTPFWRGFWFWLDRTIEANDLKYMKRCWPEEYQVGHGKGFGLISEAKIIFGNFAPFYFSLCAIQVSLLLYFTRRKTGLIGVLLYAQSAEIFYKLYRIDMTYTYVNLLFTLTAITIFLMIYKFILHTTTKDDNV